MSKIPVVAIFIIFVFLNKKKESKFIMNIGRITTSNVYKQTNEVKAKNQKNITKQQAATVPNTAGTSVNEILGRTQVSFTGKNIIRQNYYEHDCNEPFGVKENIHYNKEDGSYVHTVTNRNGSLKSKEEYYPLEQKEIITRVLKNGIEVTENIGTESSKITRTDREGREVFLQTKDALGNLKTIETSYRRGRQVIKEENNNGSSSIKIIDTKTGNEVTEGPLVYNEEYDNKTDRYNTVNILTGIVEKSVKYGPKKEVTFEERFSPLTGELTERTQFNPYINVTYNKDGIREFKTTLSDDNRIKHVYKYSLDGQTETQHVRYVYNQDHHVVEKRNYVPGTNLLSETVKYADDGSKKVTKYRENSNIPLTTETFDDNDELIAFEKFHKDGKQLKERLSQQDDNFAIHEIFSEDGVKLRKSTYFGDGKLYESEEYNGVTGNLKSLMERVYNGYTVTKFDDTGTTPTRIATYSNNDQIKDLTIFYEDGVTPRTKRIYNDDKSYIEQRFDRDGNIINEKRKTNATEDTKASEVQEKEQEENTDLEFLENIAQIISRQDYNIPTEEDWDRLAEILEVEDKENLFPIDKATYRKLATKYHPDKHIGEDGKKNETIFGILNNLYHFEMQ